MEVEVRQAKAQQSTTEAGENNQNIKAWWPTAEDWQPNVAGTLYPTLLHPPTVHDRYKSYHLPSASADLNYSLQYLKYPVHFHLKSYFRVIF